MKFRNILFNLAIATFTLLTGLALVSGFNFLFGNGCSITQQNNLLTAENSVVAVENDNVQPLLPIDFEEDKLTSPHADENNPAYFDPEGYYFFDGFPKGFEDFLYIKISNKNFDVAKTDDHYGDLIPLNGAIILDTKNGDEQINFAKINIANGKMHFETQEDKGITYEFDGNFLVNGNFYTLSDSVKVLQGTLIKKENGKTVAKKDLNFNWTLETE